jgi:hypothetical protein
MADFIDVKTAGVLSQGLTYETGSANQGSYMPLFDTRLYRTLGLFSQSNQTFTITNKNVGTSSNGINEINNSIITIYPHFDYRSYIGDFYESPESILAQIEEFANIKGSENTVTFTHKDGTALDSSLADEAKHLYDKAIEINKFITDSEKQKRYMAAHSFIHPYAIVKLAGASGDHSVAVQQYTYDRVGKRKWYEVDGNAAGGYAKNPTTTTLINWGNEDMRGRFPYSFQDFVFCKDWTKIPNNRLITLRKYTAPVTDAVTFSDNELVEQGSKDKSATITDDKGNNITVENRESNDTNSTSKIIKYNIKQSTRPWSPVATAVTYFGEGTDNNLSDLLQFSAHYNWDPITAESHPIDISSTQQEQGSNLLGPETPGGSALSSGLSAISKMLGWWDTMNGHGINPALAANVPPDPYTMGPYENRILGPINVIMNTYKRKRGLTFEHSITVTFKYKARPIGGINSKAVLLDLLSNMLVLCYASGSWFGGMWRYKCDEPAMYPFKYGDVMNKLYQGKIFGSNGAVSTLIKHVYNDGSNFFTEVFKEGIKAAKELISGAIDAITGAINTIAGKKEEGEDNRNAAKSHFKNLQGNKLVTTFEKVLAAKCLKSATIPYVTNMKALLTGDVVGNWHLTIGNPLNPIAMIGNLVATNLQITFDNELGPDDFPIGFTAKVTLEHGLGRDRDAIESMFNRGYGRIYSLPVGFRSTADGETRIDAYTGTDGKPRMGYAETSSTFFGRGFRFIAKIQQGNLNNTGTIYRGTINNYKSLVLNDQSKYLRASAGIMVNPWQMAYCL